MSRASKVSKVRANPAALIIAGGKGTRFWPASRGSYPKPLFSIDKGTTLLGETIARLQPLIARETSTFQNLLKLPPDRIPI